MLRWRILDIYFLHMCVHSPLFPLGKKFMKTCPIEGKVTKISWTKDCKEIQPVHSKGDQPCVFFGRNDAKAETPILCPPHTKSWLIGNDSDAGRDCGQEEKGTTEDETAGWHHGLDGRESEWTPGAGDRQGGLASCDSWGRKESDTTEWLNWTDLNWIGLRGNPANPS